MINIVEGRAQTEALLKDMRLRAADTDKAVSDTAAEILEDIRRNGLKAVEAYAEKFDGVKPYELTQAQISAAADACPKELYHAMERAAENIRDYQSRLLPESSTWQVETDSRLGQIVRGLDRVGLYVPGGRAAYPSTVLMTAIPAKVAGVRELVMVTPPTEHLNAAVLAAAQIAGVDRVIAVGGIQAIGALVYGAGFIPKADKLVGPGNSYVTAAKRLAYGKVDIDMTAGPSEVLIIADETSDPAFIAADLMSQAEHDPLASAILVTTSREIGDAVANQLKRQIEDLERREIIEQSLRDFGAILLCDNLEEACRLSETIAPEHLEIMTKDPEAVAEKIRNAGAIFLGKWSPEPLGDYMAGPSHVLPTSGTARFFSPLSVDSFLKKTSLIHYAEADLKAASGETIALAESEGLTAHAGSIRIRLERE